jgi:hypothetical protein
VRLPNGTTIYSTHIALLDMPQLPLTARQAHIFPDLSNSALLSIGQFCDNRYEARFTKHSVTIDQNNTIVLKGTRDPNGLWNLNLNDQSPSAPASQQLSHAANNVYELQNKQDIVRYLHQACCSPVPSTWIKAIEAGHFTTWSGLTTDLVRKHLPKSIATTTKGHLGGQPQGLQSTKAKHPNLSPESEHPSVMTTAKPPAVRTRWVFMKPIKITGQIFSNQTGRFPITSSQGNKYIMVVYDYDSDAIITEPITSRNKIELLCPHTKIHTILTGRGLKPVLQKLDNKAPGKLQTFMRQNDVSFQLVPPCQHRRNAAKRAIATWMDHFVATLATTDPAFPLHLWCRLIDQASTTLDLLRQSRINPQLSAEAQLNRAFDYNKTPFAPPGKRVVVHETPKNRRTWDSHGVDGWYIGRAPKHYRYHCVYVSKTASERIADTVNFFPYHCEMLKTSSADAARHAATALTHALQNPAPATLFAPIGDAQMRVIDQLAKRQPTTTTRTSQRLRGCQRHLHHLRGCQIHPNTPRTNLKSSITTHCAPIKRPTTSAFSPKHTPPTPSSIPSQARYKSSGTS